MERGSQKEKEEKTQMNKVDADFNRGVNYKEDQQRWGWTMDGRWCENGGAEQESAA